MNKTLLTAAAVALRDIDADLCPADDDSRQGQLGTVPDKQGVIEVEAGDKEIGCTASKGTSPQRCCAPSAPKKMW